MRIQQTLGARLDWFDRNPTTRTFAYSSSFAVIAPHAPTVRWTYTVPANRKFALQVGQVLVNRVTIAAPAAQQYSALEYTPAAGGTSNVLSIVSYSNTVGDLKGGPMGSGLIMMPGDAIQSQTFDSSTG